MIRVPILSAVAAALLLGFAASVPAAAEDAQSSPAPAAAPAPSAPAKGEFDNSCAMGLAEGQTLKTDCSVNWTAPDGKVYCFSSENSKATFLKNAEANIKQAQDFRASKAAAAASGKTKNFTEEDVNAAVKTAIINKRAGGMGLISGRKAFQRPMAEGVELLNAIQDVYLDRDVTIA